MGYKIIALDIDGTLTDSSKKITQGTRKALAKFCKLGGKVILASGRPTPGIVPHAKTLQLDMFGGYILAYNGGCVIDCSTNEILFQSVMPRKYISDICDIIKGRPVGINTYEGENIIVGNNMNKYTELEARINGMGIKYVDDFADSVDYYINKCLIHGEPEEILKLEEILSSRYEGKLGVFKSEPFFLEIVPQGIDKAQSIDRLLKLIGMNREECIACGDGYNDISMLKYSGLGVAMANASETVKSAADYITLSNDEDGIVYLLDKLGLLSESA